MLRAIPHISLIARFLAPVACVLIGANVTAAHGAFSEAGRTDDPAFSKPQMNELDGSLEFTLVVGAWVPRFDGNVTLGSQAGVTATRFELGPDLRLDGLEPTLLPELAIRKRDIWEMHFSGFYFSTSSRGTMERSGSFGDLDFAIGDGFRSDVDLISAAGELRIGLFRAYANDRDDNLTSDGNCRVDFRFAPLIGLRYVEVDHVMERIGGAREETGGTWLVPYGGFRMELTYVPDGALPIIRMMRLEAGAALGPALGADGGFAWKVRAGLTCNITDNLGVMFGYRLLELEVESDGYELNGGLQGLFIAGSLRF